MLTARAPGELVFMLDADNRNLPTTLGRLTEALDDDPEASFAYSIVGTHTEGEPLGLVSGLPWEPARLAEGNYIDAMSMWRRADLVELGGYVEDPRLQGWEDYDLWCHCAQAGRRGVMVHEILGWYRRTAHATLALMDLDVSAAKSLVRERSPAVFHAARRAPQPRLVATAIPDDTRAYPAAGSIAIFGPYKSGTTALFSIVRNSLPDGTRTLFEPEEYVREAEDSERIVLAKVILAVPEGPGVSRLIPGLRPQVYTRRDRALDRKRHALHHPGSVYRSRALESVLALLAKAGPAERAARAHSHASRGQSKSLERTAAWIARQLE